MALISVAAACTQSPQVAEQAPSSPTAEEQVSASPGQPDTPAAPDAPTASEAADSSSELEPDVPEPPTPEPSDEQTTASISEQTDEGTEAPEVSASDSAPAGEGQTSRRSRQFEIIDILPRDAILAIFDPQFVSASEADEFMGEFELVLGLTINGDKRAYSLPFLDSHEIVNDVVGGKPVAVTW